MANLSDRNNKIKIIEKPQSPQVAGMQVTLPPGAPIPSGWVELNGQTLVGAETEYPDLWLNAPASWKSGSDLVLPDGPLRTRQFLLSLSSTPSGWSSSSANGFLEKLADGKWYLNFNIGGTYSTSAANQTLVIDGVTSSVGTAVAMQGEASAGVNAYYSPGADALAWYVGGTNTNNVAMQGYIEIDTPTDAIMAASSFSTIAEALEGTPCIKLYSDTASAVSVGINGATDTVAGVVKANKSQTKILQNSFSNNNQVIPDLTFNNLVIGKAYRVSGNIAMRLDGNTGQAGVIISPVGTTAGATAYGFVASYAANLEFPVMSYCIEFIATSSQLTFVTSSLASPQDLISGTGLRTGTYATLTELNNTVETTDFT